LQEKEAVIQRLHAACTDLQHQLREKEAVIQHLHAACTDLQRQLRNVSQENARNPTITS
jgi:prefoldin subunit 5